MFREFVWNWPWSLSSHWWDESDHGACTTSYENGRSCLRVLECNISVIALSFNQFSISHFSEQIEIHEKKSGGEPLIFSFFLLNLKRRWAAINSLTLKKAEVSRYWKTTEVSRWLKFWLWPFTDDQEYLGSLNKGGQTRTTTALIAFWTWNHLVW